ncbi:MAG: hypothetical protein MHMPM18_002306 [Marteilia pararefringens]
MTDIKQRSPFSISQPKKIRTVLKFIIESQIASSVDASNLLEMLRDYVAFIETDVSFFIKILTFCIRDKRKSLSEDFSSIERHKELILSYLKLLMSLDVPNLKILLNYFGYAFGFDLIDINLHQQNKLQRLESDMRLKRKSFMNSSKRNCNEDEQSNFTKTFEFDVNYFISKYQRKKWNFEKGESLARNINVQFTDKNIENKRLNVLNQLNIFFETAIIKLSTNNSEAQFHELLISEFVTQMEIAGLEAEALLKIFENSSNNLNCCVAFEMLIKKLFVNNLGSKKLKDSCLNLFTTSNKFKKYKAIEDLRIQNLETLRHLAPWHPFLLELAELYCSYKHKPLDCLAILKHLMEDEDQLKSTRFCEVLLNCMNFIEIDQGSEKLEYIAEFLCISNPTFKKSLFNLTDGKIKDMWTGIYQNL